MPVDKTKTLAQEYQAILYGLFQEKLFNIEGCIQLGDNDGIPEPYVPKALVVERGIEILNEIGKILVVDRRFTDEIDTGKNNTLPEEAKTD